MFSLYSREGGIVTYIVHGYDPKIAIWEKLIKPSSLIYGAP